LPAFIIENLFGFYDIKRFYKSIDSFFFKVSINLFV